MVGHLRADRVANRWRSCGTRLPLAGRRLSARLKRSANTCPCPRMSLPVGRGKSPSGRRVVVSSIPGGRRRRGLQAAMTTTSSRSYRPEAVRKENHLDCAATIRTSEGSSRCQGRLAVRFGHIARSAEPHNRKTRRLTRRCVKRTLPAAHWSHPPVRRVRTLCRQNDAAIGSAVRVAAKSD